MKHIYIIDEHISSKQNGIGTYMKQIINCCKNENTEVNLISYNDESDKFVLKYYESVKVYCVPFCGRGAFLKIGNLSFAVLKQYITDNKDNIFFVNHSPCVDFLKALKRYFPKSKIVFTIHDQGWTAPLLGNEKALIDILNRVPVKKEFRKNIRFIRKYFSEEKRMYKLVDAVVCLSESTYNLLQNVYNIEKDKIHLIPNALQTNKKSENIINRNDARRILNIDKDETILFYAGRIVRAKGIFELVKAFNSISFFFPKARLVIAGEMHQQEEIVKFATNSITKITFTGLISQELMNLWYAVADIGVHPSYTEQCSFTCLEMMKKIGLILTTDGLGLRDMFKNYKNAIVIHIPHNSDNMENELTDNIIEGLKIVLKLGEETKARLKENCKKDLQDKYSYERMMANYSKLMSSFN